MGKCNLYVAGGGFNPSRALPITVDMGCDNPEVLNSGFYLGLQPPVPWERNTNLSWTS